MKKIEIQIREINLNDDFEEIGDKRVVSAHILHDDDETNFEDILSMVLDDRWPILKNFYLRKRKDVPFRKIRKDGSYHAHKM